MQEIIKIMETNIQETKEMLMRVWLRVKNLEDCMTELQNEKKEKK